ncbi:MAG: killer suppression protein HigA [Acidobacteriota bacterium]
MDIYFANQEVKRLCLVEREAKKRLGPPSAKKLRARLADLAAARQLDELVAGRPHPLKGERAGQFAVSLHGGARLVFEAADEPPVVTPDGATDWHRVRSIRIVFVGDYHD